MSINFTAIAFLVFQSILISALLLFLFRLRGKMGLSLLYTALGVFQYIQVYLASTFYFEVINGVYISPGSSVLFTANIFTVLLVYIREDAAETRKLIYALFSANVVLTILQYMFSRGINSSDVLNPHDFPAELFSTNAWVLLAGTIFLLLDAVFIII